MEDIRRWYDSIPRFTRYWLTATVGLSLLARFDLPSIRLLYLSWPDVRYNYEIWRLVTSLFAYPLESNTRLHFLINCYFIVSYGLRLEKDQFGRSPADFLYLQLFVSTLTVITGVLFKQYFLMDTLVIGIIYIWCQLNIFAKACRVKNVMELLLTHAKLAAADIPFK